MKKRHRLVFFCSLLFLIWSCQSDSRQMDWKQSPIEIQHFSYSISSGTKDSIFNSQGIFIPTGTPFQSEVEKKSLIGFKGVVKADAKKPSGYQGVDQPSSFRLVAGHFVSPLPPLSWSWHIFTPLYGDT